MRKKQQRALEEALDALSLEGDAPPQPIRGLKNLGNTCFFNAVLQNLVATEPLRRHLLQAAEEGEGPMTRAIRQLILQMHAGSGTGAAVNPSRLLQAVSQKHRRFAGRAQQDSQEVLRQLLEGCRNEELARLKKAKRKLANGPTAAEEDTAAAATASSSEAADEAHGDVPAASDSAKCQGRAAAPAAVPEPDPQTVVDAIFGGTMRSTIVCLTCTAISCANEPFLDLSVGIPSRPATARPKESPGGSKNGTAGCASGKATKKERRLAMRQLKNKQQKAAAAAGYESGATPADEEESTSQADDQSGPLGSPKASSSCASVEGAASSAAAAAGAEAPSAAEAEAPSAPAAAEESASTHDPSAREDASADCTTTQADASADAAAAQADASADAAAARADVSADAAAAQANASADGSAAQADASADGSAAQADAPADGSAAQVDAAANAATAPAVNSADDATAGSSADDDADQADASAGVDVDHADASAEVDAAHADASADVDAAHADASADIHAPPADAYPDIDAAAVDASADVAAVQADACAHAPGSAGAAEVAASASATADTRPASVARASDAATADGEQPTTQLAALAFPGHKSEAPLLAAAQAVEVAADAAGMELGAEVAPVVRSEVDLEAAPGTEREGSGSNAALDSSSVRAGLTLESQVAGTVTSALATKSLQPSAKDGVWRHWREVGVEHCAAQVLSKLPAQQTTPPEELSLTACLQAFTQPEILQGDDSYECEACLEERKAQGEDSTLDKRQPALKWLQIVSMPQVLTLHLKRFSALSGRAAQKVNHHVPFPLELNLSPFCGFRELPQQLDDLGRGCGYTLRYSLIGVVEHQGSMNGGHYTAFVRTSRNVPARWHHFSDTHVSEVEEAAVLRAQAFLLFYEVLCEQEPAAEAPAE